MWASPHTKPKNEEKNRLKILWIHRLKKKFNVVGTQKKLRLSCYYLFAPKKRSENAILKKNPKTRSREEEDWTTKEKKN